MMVANTAPAARATRRRIARNPTGQSFVITVPSARRKIRPQIRPSVVAINAVDLFPRQFGEVVDVQATLAAKANALVARHLVPGRGTGCSDFECPIERLLFMLLSAAKLRNSLRLFRAVTWLPVDGRAHAQNARLPCAKLSRNGSIHQREQTRPCDAPRECCRGRTRRPQRPARSCSVLPCRTQPCPGLCLILLEKLNQRRVRGGLEALISTRRLNLTMRSQHPLSADPRLLARPDSKPGPLPDQASVAIRV